ncbi:MAG: hypothetical protein HY855_08370 [Burkholderiales bacterium]|nr:hypothetical protein [Burkholderiales bacterium]
MSGVKLYPGRAGLEAMLSTRQCHGDLYDSYYELPIEAHAFSTERKVVRKGEGPLLQRFLQEPIHTSPDRSVGPLHSLPRWMFDAVESTIVQAGRSHCAYTLELLGIGRPSVGWVLQRLQGRRAMLYHSFGPIHGMSDERLRETAQHFRLAYWTHVVHFVLRMNAFDSEQALDTWLMTHADASRPVRRGLPPISSVPAFEQEATPWFDAMGHYAPPCALDLDDEAAAFAFDDLTLWQRLKASWNRGPDNAIVNIANLPLELCRLAWPQTPEGTVLTRFSCDLRFELYG